MQPSVRSIAVRSLEAAGLVVYAYLIGGLITEVRLFVAGLPSGAQMLTVVPNAQIVATGAKALITWGSVSVGVFFLLGALWAANGPVAKIIVRVVPSRRKSVARTLALFAVVMLFSIVATLIALLIGPGPHGHVSSGLGPYGWGATVAGLVIGFGIMVPGVMRRSHVSPSAPFAARVGASNLVAGLLVMTAFVSVGTALDGPTKLSMAAVHEKSGVCVSGPLVASTSDGAYLADGLAHTVTLVRAEAIESVVVERRLVVVKQTRVHTTNC